MTRIRATRSEAPLPPPELRLGDPGNRDDATYIANAVALARSVDELRRQVVALPPDAAPLADLRVLDFGCGTARLLTGLLALDAPFARYLGVDVQAAPIEWARSALGEPRVRFLRVSTHNERYNPDGRPFDGLDLGEPAASFDVVVLRSVVTHMRLADARAHTAELRRYLAPGGHVYLSAFIEDDVPAESINPPGYRFASHSGALHVVRFARAAFEEAMREAGLRPCLPWRPILGQSTCLFACE